MTGATPEKPKRGYGNIYTPNAGAMIIHVHRESGLANRTIILTLRQVRYLKIGLSTAAVLIILGSISWFYLASQAARVPTLTKRVTSLQREVERLDTLQVALNELDGRFHQVQRMLGVPTTANALPAGTEAVVDWPLPSDGTVLTDASHGAGAADGVDIAIAQGTPVRAAGAGVVVEIRTDVRDGTLLRIAHRDGYETVYGNLDSVRVAQGDTLQPGTVIALSGGPTSSLPAHLHFELKHGGVSLDPSPLMKEGSQHGNVH